MCDCLAQRRRQADTDLQYIGLRPCLTTATVHTSAAAHKNQYSCRDWWNYIYNAHCCWHCQKKCLKIQYCWTKPHARIQLVDVYELHKMCNIRFETSCRKKAKNTVPVHTSLRNKHTQYMTINNYHAVSNATFCVDWFILLSPSGPSNAPNLTPNWWRGVGTKARETLKFQNIEIAVFLSDFRSSGAIK